MKILLIGILILVVILFSGCVSENEVVIDENSQAIACLPEQRNMDGCIEIYQPVCGTVNIQCITTPCNPVKETFENYCKACTNPLVSSYTKGKCEK